MTGGLRSHRTSAGRIVSLIPFLTVVRMQGMQSLRPDVRWRPEVSISFDGVDEAQTHKFALGVDGRNPSLKTLIPMSVSISPSIHGYSF